MGQLISAHETHITSTHYSHNSAPPTTRADRFLWTTISSCCCKARSGRSACCCNTLYPAKITAVQAVIFWRRLPTLQQQQSSSPVRHRRTRKLTSLQLSVRRCPVSGPTPRGCTGGSVRGTNQGKNAMLPASPRRQGVSSVHPQRCQGFDPTFSQGIILYYTPEAICQKCIVFGE